MMESRSTQQQPKTLRPSKKAVASTGNPGSEGESRLSELMRRNNQLESLIAMRSHLQANVAHEIRTPLAAIRGYTRMVLDGRAGEVNEQQLEFLNIVTENTNKLIHLVNWMSRVIESSEQEMQIDLVDIGALWGECVSHRRTDLSARAVTLRESFAQPTFRVMADESRIRRVFDNLIYTAVEFSAHGTQLTVDFSRPREGGVGVRLSGITHPVPEIMREGLDALPDTSGIDGHLHEIHDIVGMHGGRFFIRRTRDEGSMLIFTMQALDQPDFK
jgi:signal transduction histidine kinase